MTTVDDSRGPKQLCCKIFTKRTAHKPDSVRSWVVCAAGMITTITVYGTINSFGVIYPSLLHHFQEGMVKTAWVGSLAMSLTCFLAPVAGFLLGRLDPRLVILGGLICCSLGLFLTSRVSSLWMMFLTYSVLFAFGSSCAYTALLSVVPRYFVKKRSFATSVICVGPGAGVLLISQVLEQGISALNWRGALLILAGIHLILCVLAAVFDPNVEKVTMNRGECGGVWVRHHSNMETRLWRNRMFMMTNLAIAIHSVGFTIPQVHMARYCEDLGISLTKASKLYLVYGIASMAFRVITGRLSDLTWVNPRYLAQIGFLMMGLSTLLCPLARSFDLLMVYFTSLGMADGLDAGAVNIMVLASVPEHCYAKAIGLSMLIQSFGIVGGPPLGGFIAKSLGSYTPAFFTSGSLCLLATAVLFFVGDNKGKQEITNIGEELESRSTTQSPVIQQETAL